MGGKYVITLGDTSNMIYVSPTFPHDNSYDLILKIGVINDNDLLEKLSKKTNDSLSLLLEYAKNNDGTSFDISSDDIGAYKLENIDYTVTDGAYYYLYTSYKNNNGLRDLSDVSVAMAKEGWLFVNEDFEFSDDEIYDKDETNSEINNKTNDEITTNSEINNKTNDEITTNSKTGDVLIFIVWAIGIGTLVYSMYYFKSRKNNINKI